MQLQSILSVVILREDEYNGTTNLDNLEKLSTYVFTMNLIMVNMKTKTVRVKFGLVTTAVNVCFT